MAMSASSATGNPPMMSEKMAKAWASGPHAVNLTMDGCGSTTCAVCCSRVSRLNSMRTPMA